MTLWYPHEYLMAGFSESVEHTWSKTVPELLFTCIYIYTIYRHWLSMYQLRSMNSIQRCWPHSFIHPYTHATEYGLELLIYKFGPIMRLLIGHHPWVPACTFNQWTLKSHIWDHLGIWWNFRPQEGPDFIITSFETNSFHPYPTILIPIFPEWLVISHPPVAYRNWTRW